MIKYHLENTNWTLERATEGSSGYDLRASINTERHIEPGGRWLVCTGLFLDMPIGVEAQVRSRSGLAINHGVVVLNAPGTIDADYRGEVKVSLINLGQQSYRINPGDKIAQLVFAPVLPEFIDNDVMEHRLRNYVYGSVKRAVITLERVSKEDLSSTIRGSGGHGSTGR